MYTEEERAKFKDRFLRWKNGEKVYKDGLPAYRDGKEDEFDAFLKTLPDNQSAPGAYNTRRYWELNGKPKNFAEAIGIGMYNVQKDNGILGWHANSVSYNDKNDTYEFMKPNYHPTRWMELVYGYDKDQAFQKDWKVQYNGPMLSDRYVRREKPGFKIKGGLLPKFASGKISEYVQAGTDNSWTRVTNDPMGAVFLDLVVRPLSRGGNTTVGNWKRQWSPKYEKPLEIISPEFDLISGVRGIIGMLPKKATTITTKNAAKITPKLWDAAYFKALDTGDKIEAQRLRDLHFKVKAPNTKITTADGNPAHIYHGTDANWVKYDASKFGSSTDDGYYGVGLYGTEYRPLAKGYGDNVLDLYINAERPYTAGTQDIFGNPYTLDEAVDRASIIRYFNRDREGVVFGNAGNYANTDFPKLLKEIDNADAAVYGTPNQRFNEVVIPRGEQMKLADAVTYDDAGTIIPLSKRDNFNINDIRYGLFPFGLGLTGYNYITNTRNKPRNK